MAAEVDRAIVELRRLRRSGARSVGLVTPFRVQADALERAVLHRLSGEDLNALDLRVGTVHGFQGNERDVTIACFDIGSDEDANTWRFVEDPHLFTVFATRARRRMMMLISADPPPGGLVGRYLGQADAPPGPPASQEPADPWVAAIAEDLRSAGVGVITSYPTGRHRVDLVVGSGRDQGIECGVHSDGAEAHIERHLSLQRSGWELVEAYQSRWSEQRPELVIDLIRRIGPSTTAGQRIER